MVEFEALRDAAEKKREVGYARMRKGIRVVAFLSDDVASCEPINTVDGTGHVVWVFQNETVRPVPLSVAAILESGHTKWKREHPTEFRLHFGCEPGERCESQPLLVLEDGIEHLRHASGRRANWACVEFTAKKSEDSSMDSSTEADRIRNLSKVALEAIKSLPIVGGGAAAVKEVLDQQSDEDLQQKIAAMLSRSESVDKNVVAMSLRIDRVDQSVIRVANAIEEMRQLLAAEPETTGQAFLRVLEDEVTESLTEVFSARGDASDVKENFFGYFGIEVKGETMPAVARNVARRLPHLEGKKVGKYFEDVVVPHAPHKAAWLRDVASKLCKSP